MQNLRVDGFVPLAVRLGSDIDIDHSVIGEFNLRGFVRIAKDRLNVVADPEAAQFPPSGALGPPPVKSVKIRLDLGPGEDLVEFADVKSLHAEIPVGEPFGRNEVSAAQFGLADAEFPGGTIHEALNHVYRLRAARPAIGVNRRGVGVDALDAEVHRRDEVGSRQHLLGKFGLDELSEE